MAILRIRDKNGEIHEIMALRGEKGADGAGRETENGSVNFIDLENNVLYSKNSVCFGTDLVTGHKGFPMSEVTLSADSKSAVITLADKDLEDKACYRYAVGDMVQFDAKNHWYDKFTIIATSQTKNGDSTITIAYPDGGVISESNIALDSDTSQNWLWVVEKQVGLPITCQKASSAFGESNLAAGRSTSAIGRGNKAIGNYSGAVGRNHKTGYCAFAVGYNNSAMGHYTFSAGCNNVVKGIHSVGIGDRVKVNKNCSLAVGQLASTNAEGSIACGISCSTGEDGYAAVALGIGSKANGFASFAAGDTSTADGKDAVAFGYRSIAGGDFSLAAGYECKAYGNRSIALGSSCTANGDQSMACGHFNATQAPYQTVFGKFSKMTADMLFGVGDGTQTDYHNAFSVYEDGHAEIRTQGTTDNSVVTKEYVDKLLEQIEQLKQAVIELGGNVE
jgi:hypothetical protein